MAVLPNTKVLLIPNKAKTSANGTVKQSDYGTDMRTIEQWAAHLHSGYASLTGPGETTSPGALTQMGNFEVVDTSGLNILTVGVVFGVLLEATGSSGIAIISTGGGGITIENSSTSPIQIEGHSAADIIIDMSLGTGNIILLGLPTSAPATPGALWNNGGVVNIV